MATLSQAGFARLRCAGFFLLFFLYLYLLVDPKLIFFAHATLLELKIFSEYDTLLLDIWRRPAGAGVFFAEYLMKYAGLKWAGPAIQTTLAVLIYWATGRLTASVHEKPIPRLRFEKTSDAGRISGP